MPTRWRGIRAAIDRRTPYPITNRPGIWPAIWPDIRPAIRSDIRPAIGSDIRPAIRSDIGSGIPPDIGSGIRPVIRPHIRPGIRPGILRRSDKPIEIDLSLKISGTEDQEGAQSENGHAKHLKLLNESPAWDDPQACH